MDGRKKLDGEGMAEEDVETMRAYAVVFPQSYTK